jgi:hypothetical protein
MTLTRARLAPSCLLLCQRFVYFTVSGLPSTFFVLLSWVAHVSINTPRLRPEPSTYLSDPISPPASLKQLAFASQWLRLHPQIAISYAYILPRNSSPWTRSFLVDRPPFGLVLFHSSVTHTATTRLQTLAPRLQRALAPFNAAPNWSRPPRVPSDPAP